MAKVGNTATRVWLSQFDLSGFLGATDLKINQQNIPVTTFSDTGPRRLVGTYDHTHEHTGFFDGVTITGIDAIIHALVASDADKYLAQMFGANVEGSIVYESIIALSGKPLSGQFGGAVLLNQSMVGRGGLYRGQVLRNATVTGTGNGTGRNLGISTSPAVFAAVFRVFSGTFTSISMQIQQSSDDGAGDAYANIAGLDSGTMLNANVVFTSTTATTEAWKRVAISAFVGTNCVIGVTAGIVAGT